MNVESTVTPWTTDPMKALRVSGLYLRLGLVDQRLQEGVLALDAAEVAGPVVLPVAVLVVLVVAAAGHGQRVAPVQVLAACRVMSSPV